MDAGRRGHDGGQPGDGHAPTAWPRTARPASTASASASSRSGTRNCAGWGASTMRAARRAAVAEARDGGLRQHQPRPDAVAARRRRSRTSTSRSSALIELEPGTRLALPARAVPERAARARRWRAAGWSLAPDDDAADMYLRAMARLGTRRLRAVRDLERGAARPALAPQHEILDRRRVGRVRLRRPLDSRPRPVEQCERPPSSTSTRIESGRVGRRRAPPAVAAGAGGGGAVHGTSARRGRVDGSASATSYGVDVWAEWGREPRTLRGRGPAGARWRAAAADARGHAPEQRSNDSFSRRRQYGKVTAFHGLSGVKEA